MTVQQRLTLTLLDPTEGPRATVARAAPRLASLEGARLGLVDNGKYRVGPLLNGLAEELERRHGARVVQAVRKPAAGRGLSRGEVAAFKQEVDAVLNGVGD